MVWWQSWPGAASAECFVSGSGLTGNAASLSAGLAVGMEVVWGWFGGPAGQGLCLGGQGVFAGGVPCSDWAFQAAWLAHPTLQAWGWDPQFPVPAGSWPTEAPDVGSCW